MSRDMQIGLVLAVGFLALVGGVLYYRIEHPDELEQYLNGGQQAQATTPNGSVPDTSKPDQAPGTLANNTSASHLPPAPTNTSAPPIDVNVPSLANNNPGTAPHNSGPGTANSGSTTSNNVVLTGGAAGTNNTPPAVSMPTPPANNAPPVIDLTLDKKPAETKPATTTAASETKKEVTGTTTSRSSLPTEPPSGATTLPTAPPLTAPNINFDITPKNTAPVATTPLSTAPAEAKKTEEKKPEEKKPADVVVKPEGNNSAGGVPPALTPPSMTPPSMTPPAMSTNTTTPGNGAPATNSLANGPTTPPANTNVASDTTIKPSNSNPPSDVNKSQELPQPPVVTPPNAGILYDSKPGSNPSASSASNQPPLTNPASPLNTGNSSNPTSAPVTDADGFRTFSPKVGLGKPLAESEATLREKRWADSTGSPSPIIPLSTENRSSPTTVTPTNLGDRRVVRDTYIPTERAQRGETFSSLSQRLYGDTNYAAALAAYNHEFGFVKMDQPEANEWVAKPNREILDQRYPQLIRRLTPTNIKSYPENGTPTSAAAGNAASTANLPTYRVGKGEQLFDVAKKTLGDGYRWSEIYALNKEMLRDNTELRPDMVLKLPVDAKK